MDIQTRQVKNGYVVWDNEDKNNTWVTNTEKRVPNLLKMAAKASIERKQKETETMEEENNE